jgi:enoyl-CoA hydratase
MEPTMSDAHLLVSFDGPVALLTLNRPDKLNALDAALLAEVARVTAELAARPQSDRPRVAILTGAGDRAFAAGADVAELTRLTPVEARALSANGHRAGRALEEAPFPVIAAVNGFALGGGCELALACDFIYASDKARFGQPEVGLGLVPGFGGTQRLARRVGIGRARELVYTGAAIDAERARAIGLVNEVVPHAELMTRVTAVATAIAARPPLAVAAAKRLLLQGPEADLRVANELETEAFGALFATHDAREGTRAFVERRTPAFDGS